MSCCLRPWTIKRRRTGSDAKIGTLRCGIPGESPYEAGPTPNALQVVLVRECSRSLFWHAETMVIRDMI